MVMAKEVVEVLKCGLCQKIISWTVSKDIITGERLSCPYCKASLVFSNHAVVIVQILDVSLWLIFLYVLYFVNFFENAFTAFPLFISIAIFSFTLKRHAIYGISRLFSFPLVRV